MKNNTLQELFDDTSADLNQLEETVREAIDSNAKSRESIVRELRQARELEKISNEDYLRLTTLVRTIPPLSGQKTIRSALVNRLSPLQHPEPAEGNAQNIAVGDRLIGRFDLTHIIYQDALGILFQAQDIKEAKADPQAIVSIFVFAEAAVKTPDAFTALQRTAQLAQQLDHPSIAKVFAIERDGDKVFMTLEALDGRLLDVYLQEEHTTHQTAMRLIKAITDGITHAHEQDIIHADLRPSNICVTEQGEIKLLHFGISQTIKDCALAHQDKTEGDANLIATFATEYASCETLANQPPNPSSDIYALACITYELLTGKHPFKRTPATAAQAARQMPEPHPRLSKQEWRALNQALCFDPRKRTKSSYQFYQDLIDQRNVFARNQAKFALVGVVALLSVALLWFNQPTVVPEPPAQANAANAAADVERATANENSTPDKALIATTQVQAEQQVPTESPAQPPAQSSSTQPVTPVDDNSAQIAQLLAKGEKQIREYKLTVPRTDNAWLTYQAILALDPNHPGAHSGLAKIADTYAALAYSEAAQAQWETALGYINKALEIQPNSSNHQQQKQRIRTKIVELSRNH